MAAALIVPAGVAVSAQSAGAASDNATCTTNTGTMKASPGVSLTVRQSQTIVTKGGTLDSCTGVGIADSTSATFNWTVQRAAVSCKNIKGTTFAGSGQIKWSSDGSNAGVITKVILRVKFNSLTQIQFSGQVTSTYLHGGKIKGTATIPPNLRSAGDNGGTCANSKASRVKKLDYTNNSDFTIGV
jgi:hypothetical protein